jgi:nucleoside-diphosphate-sugar epimerase
MKQVLITGSTGAIGSALVPHFLDEPETGVHLLVRARSSEHLEQRREELLRFWELSEHECSIVDRIHFYAGDVCQKNVGLSNGVFDDLASSITHIVHCAGNVKLNQPMDIARQDALGSAKSIVTFAVACLKHGQFRKLDVTSTVGVAGRAAGLVPEQRLRAPREFHNTYEAAKAEAEDYLWRAIDDGLPCTIHRPSMVVGDSQTGKIIRFQVFYYLCEFLSGSKSFGYLPRLGQVRLDTIPVDYVARAIYLSNCLSETQGKVLHLCSGPEKAMPLRSVAEIVRTILASGGLKLHRPKYLPHWIFHQAINTFKHFAPTAQRRMLETVPYFLEYLREIQVFDVQQTARILGPLGLVVPDFDQYIGAVLDYRMSQSKQRCQTDSGERNGVKGVAALASV